MLETKIDTKKHFDQLNKDEAIEILDKSIKLKEALREFKKMIGSLRDETNWFWYETKIKAIKMGWFIDALIQDCNNVLITNKNTESE